MYVQGCIIIRGISLFTGVSDADYYKEKNTKQIIFGNFNYIYVLIKFYFTPIMQKQFDIQPNIANVETQNYSKIQLRRF
jgi:hypothetical protein